MRRAMRAWRRSVHAVFASGLILLFAWAWAAAEGAAETPTETGMAPAGTVRVRVGGEVLRPGSYWMVQGSSMGEAIARAGGFTAGADPARVRLTRATGETSVSSFAEVFHLEPPAGAAQAPAALADGDEVQVVRKAPVEMPSSEAGNARVTVCGMVMKPGVYVLPEEARLVDAVGGAGGVGPEADLRRVLLIHGRNASGPESEGCDLSGGRGTPPAVNRKLVDGDVVVVPPRPSSVAVLRVNAHAMRMRAALVAWPWAITQIQQRLSSAPPSGQQRATYDPAAVLLVVADPDPVFIEETLGWSAGPTSTPDQARQTKAGADSVRLEADWPPGRQEYYLEQTGPDTYRRVAVADKTGYSAELRLSGASPDSGMELELTRKSFTAGKYDETIRAYIGRPTLIKTIVTSSVPAAPGHSVFVVWQPPGKPQAAAPGGEGSQPTPGTPGGPTPGVVIPEMEKNGPSGIAVIVEVGAEPEPEPAQSTSATTVTPADLAAAEARLAAAKTGVESAETRLTAAEGKLTDAEGRFSRGIGNQVDVLDARVGVAGAKEDIAKAQAACAEALASRDRAPAAVSGQTASMANLTPADLAVAEARVAAAKAGVGAAEARLTAAEGKLSLAKARYASGTAGQVEVLDAQSALAGVKEDLAKAQAAQAAVLAACDRVRTAVGGPSAGVATPPWAVGDWQMTGPGEDTGILRVSADGTLFWLPRSLKRLALMNTVGQAFPGTVDDQGNVKAKWPIDGGTDILLSGTLKAGGTASGVAETGPPDKRTARTWTAKRTG
jgi:protein involved in polysaccharide export with SLBB domain